MSGTIRCFRPTMAILLAAANLTAGCATRWVVQDAPPETVVSRLMEDSYLIMPRNGPRVELEKVVIERDSLIGIEKVDPAGPDVHARRAIALSDIRQVAVKEDDGVATAFWFAGVGGFFAFMALVAAWGAAMSEGG